MFTDDLDPLDEDTLCNQVTLEQLLAQLPPEDRELMLMVSRIDYPPDYTGPWPASHDEIGAFIGTKYRGEPIAGGTVRYRRKKVLADLQRKAGIDPEIDSES